MLIRHPEARQYAHLLNDKHVLDLPTLEDTRAYTRMRLRQQRKPVAPLPSLLPNAMLPTASEADVVAEAYLLTLRLRKKIAPQHPVRLDAKTKALIYDLYQSGVLPVRLGGVAPVKKNRPNLS